MSNYSREDYRYECPHGCKSQGGRPIAASIKGWKHHMSKNHGSYTDEQLAAIVGATTPNAEQGRSLFLAEADDTGPEPDSREKTAQEPPREGNLQTEAPAPEAPKKRVKFKPKAMREFLSGLPEMFFKAKGIETDESDKKLLDAASEMMEELFGVSIEVPDTEWIIKSRWMALLFPFAAILVVWGKHTFTMDFFKKKEEHPESQERAE